MANDEYYEYRQTKRLHKGLLNCSCVNFKIELANYIHVLLAYRVVDQLCIAFGEKMLEGEGGG